MNDAGRRRPSSAEIEAHFGDAAGTRPVAPGFDAEPGALCGNGRSFYALTRPAKPPPEGWVPPPPPGSDPAYQGPAPTAPFKESPYAVPAPRVVRLRPPIVEGWEPAFRDALAEALQAHSGKVAVAQGRDPLVAFDIPADRLLPVDLPADERQAHDALARAGVSLVLIDRTVPRVRPWCEDDMASLRLRLRDAGDLSWFHPVALSSGWALYRPAPPLVLDDDVRARLTARLRRLLAGAAVEPWALAAPLDAVGLPVHRAIVSLRLRASPRVGGRKLAKRMAKDAELVGALDKAAGRLLADWPAIRRTVAKEYGLAVGDLAEELPRIEIEIDVLHDVCLLADRSPPSLLWHLQPGLEGILLQDELEGVAHYLEPSYAVHHALSTPMLVLEAMLKKARLRQFLREAKTEEARRSRGDVLDEAAFQADRRFRFMRFRTANWIEPPGGGGVVSLFRGVPLKTEVTRAALVRSLQLGAGWLVRNQEPDGQYRYSYRPTNPPRTRWSAGGNIVRHALNPYTLLLVNAISPDPGYVASARRGIDFALQFLRWDGGRCVVCHRDPPAPYHIAKIGANAVLILSILELGKVEDLGGYADALRGLGEELLYLQDPNGHFRQYDVPPDHPYYGAENTIAPGEVILALARLYKWDGDGRWQRAIDRALPFYLEAWRHWRAQVTPEGVWDEENRVNLVGIVPWLVMAMKDLFDRSGERHYAEVAFEMQDWMDDTFLYTPARARWPDWVGASYKVHIEPPAINSCQYTEGAAAAFAIATSLGADVERRRRVVLDGARFCLQLQFDSYGSTFFLPDPDAAMGGYRYTLAHLHLRNDFNYHAMNALAQAVAYLAPEDYRP